MTRFRALVERLAPAHCGRLRRLRLNVSGAAMIEAAVSFPVLLVVGVGGMELANLTLAYMRISDIAMKVADNAARVRVSIDESDINQIMIGAREMGKSINFGAHGRVILSSVEPVMNTASPPAVVNQYLRWQRCYGANAANSTHGSEGDGLTGTAQATGYGVTGRSKIVAAAGTAVMLVEVVYNYQPLASAGWFGPITIRAQQSMPVRQREDQVPKNGSSLTTAQTKACSNTHAA